MISISLAVLCSYGVLWSMFRTWCWTKRAGKQAIDPTLIGKFLINTCGMIANVFFLVNTFSAVNAFLIYKTQTVVHTSLPTDDDEYSLYVYLCIAFALKLVQIIHDLAICCSVNIFFIDWERPRIRSNNLADNKPKSAEVNRTEPPKEETNIERDVETGLPRRNSFISGRNNEKILLANTPAVSIWRTYFVANEWIKLCGRRRLHLGVHIFFVILALNTMGFEHMTMSDARNESATNESLTTPDSRNELPSNESLTTPDPSKELVCNEVHSADPLNLTFKVAIGVIVYVVLALIQIVFKKLIYEKCFQHKLHEFVDLCSVSNVSVFCMPHQRFGYYIHGRSPNGRADVNMKEMHELLRREEDDLCSRRGLIPNTDHQTFEMTLPAAINEQYVRMRSLLTSYSQGADRMQGIGGRLSRVDIEKVVPTYLMINKYLSGFIEHTYKDVDYTVKEKSTLELILDAEFTEAHDRGFLYNDNGHSFENVMCFGMEYSLLAFELMMFIVADLTSGNFTFSAILTFVLSTFIKKVYLNLTRKNLVRKALVDERFLM